MTTGSVGAVLAAGYWDTQTGDPATAPGSGKYQADNWAAPALLAISAQDADGYQRSLAAIQPGDLIIEQAANNSQNYQRWAVVSVTDNTWWVQAAVTVTETGTAFTPPGSNQRRLLQVLSLTAAPPPSQAMSWQLWAPPLDPPSAGGLPIAAAQAIADAAWDTDGHLCAALQWEAYAGMLPPAPSVSSVSTGVQSVAYSPAMPGGDFGLAMARASYHRSLMGTGYSMPLEQVPPALPSAPGNPWPWLYGGTGWW